MHASPSFCLAVTDKDVGDGAAVLGNALGTGDGAAVLGNALGTGDGAAVLGNALGTGDGAAVLGNALGTGDGAGDGAGLAVGRSVWVLPIRNRSPSAMQ